MNNMSSIRILAIIPARGGSKGIPRKNIRLLNGIPLIAYVIKAALKSKYIYQTVVSTDDEEIFILAKNLGVDVIKRPKKFSYDNVPLDPVIHHAVNFIEKKTNIHFDNVITLQPTSPLLSTSSIDSAIEQLFIQDVDTVISVKEERHLFWFKKDNEYLSFYPVRKNRQYLDPIYIETGAFLLSKREFISSKNRIGKRIFPYVLPINENIDIDTYDDWNITENRLRKINIVFRVDGNNEIGLGHIYRALTLAQKFSLLNNVFFILDASKDLGVKKIKESNYPFFVFNSEEELINKLCLLKPHIIINDILDTNANYINALKHQGFFVVNFEDLGEGSEFADVVINSLYENSNPSSNHYYGYKYLCLRDEFYYSPKKKVTKNIKNILITYGGTDPNNLSLKSIKAISRLNNKQINYTIILGLGYAKKASLIRYCNKLKNEGYKIEVIYNVKNMARAIYDSDIVLTSNGRTVYEIASIGVPCISIAQNEREVRHLFVYNSRAIKYLGLAPFVTEFDILKSIDNLINSFELRTEMNQKMQSFNLIEGLDRVYNLILDKYYQYRGIKNEIY